MKILSFLIFKIKIITYFNHSNLLNFHSYNKLKNTKHIKAKKTRKVFKIIEKGKKFNKIITSKSKTIKIKPIKKNCKEKGIRVNKLFSIPHSKEELGFLFSIKNSLKKKFRSINTHLIIKISIIKIRIIII